MRRPRGCMKTYGNRQSTRLKKYDYSEPGVYFVTVCTHERQELFGSIEEGEMRLNHYGKIVNECWHEIPAHFPFVTLDEFGVMPDHAHGIIDIHDRGQNTRARHASPLQTKVAGPKPQSVGSIMGSFKSAATKRMNQLRNTPGKQIWQRGYHDRVIRNNAELHEYRKYIRNNPKSFEIETSRKVILTP